MADEQKDNGSMLGVSTTELAGLSVEELTGNATAIKMMIHYYKQLVGFATPLVGRHAFRQSSMTADLFTGDRRRLPLAPLEHFEPDACTTLLDETEDFRCASGQIDHDAVGSMLWCGPSIQNPHAGRPAIREVRDAKPCAKRIAGVGRDHSVHVEPDTARRNLAVEVLPVIGSEPFLGLENGRRSPGRRSHRGPRGTG